MAINTHAMVTAGNILWAAGSGGTLTGTPGDDVLVGTPGGPILTAGDGYDLLVGSSGDDHLNGASADIMWGGDGDDTYGVDSPSDVVIENANGGIDTIDQIPGPYDLQIVLPDYVENFVGWNGVGNDLANVMTGTAGADTLNGGGGADTLTGGAGNDTFSDTRSGHDGDTISDFGPGDTIVFTDAAFDNFTFELVGSTLTYTGGSMTLEGLHGGRIIASEAAYGDVQLTLAKGGAHDDFNGDGLSDILWRNDNGTVSDWLGQAGGGFAGNSAHDINSVPSSWHIAGTGDFNGDGLSDVLWRNDDGTVSDWLGQAGGGFAGNSAHDVNVPTSWHIASTGDFNGDGLSDILWRNDDGTVSDWLGQAGGGFAGNSAQDVNVPTSWQIAGTGDFNGDGVTDILWRNGDGTVSDWLGQSNGGFVGNSAHDINSVPSSWHIVGTGDFNGDGMTDVLWRNDDGTVSDWLGQSDGGFAGNSAQDVKVPASWHIVSVGDYNGDGMSDILWQNNNGTVSDWLGQSNGGFAGNSAHDINGVPSSWHVQDPFIHLV